MYTNRTLLQYHQQNSQLKGTIMGEYMQPCIDAFDKANGEAVAVISKKLELMEKEHFVFQGNTIVMEGPANKRTPKPKHDKTMEGFRKKHAELLDKPTEIPILCRIQPSVTE